MDETVERFALNDRGREFLVDRLTIGQSLGKLLGERILKAGGGTYTFLPPAAGRHAYAFDTGGMIAADVEHATIMGARATSVPNLDWALIELAQIHLATSQDAILLENVLAKPTDAYLKKSVPTPFFVGEEVYYLLIGVPVSSQRITEAIRAARTAGDFVGCFSELDVLDPDIDPMTRLRILAERSRAIIAGAYDGEGFVIWTTDSHWLPMSIRR